MLGLLGRAQMRGFGTLRAEVLGIFGDLGAIARARGAEETTERLAAARQRLLDERLTVVVCGEFKRGKSSLLNALLEEPGLFPVDAYYATSLITTARYAAEENISVTIAAADGSTRQLAIGRDEIVSYATESGNPGNTKRVQLISIQIPNPRLAPGLTLVDTPGVGGIYEEHSAVTLAFLNSADALVYVADATQPLLKSELAFIRRAAESARLTGDADRQLFVLTKIDAVGDFSGILANTAAKLAEVTGQPTDTLPLVPVSSRAKLDYLKNGAAEYLELSNFAALEKMLWAAVSRCRARAVLGAALADLDRAARALLIPIETELRALSGGEGRKLTTLSVQMEDRAAWLAELCGNKDKWRSDLADQFDRVLSQLRERGQQDLDGLWRNCETVYLHSDRYISAPEVLLSQVIADAAQVFGSVSELAGHAAARALQDFSARHGLELQRPEIGELPAPAVPLVHLSGNLPSADRPKPGLLPWKRAASGTTFGGTVGASVGMTIGAAIGTLFGPGPGTVVGLNFGSMIGFTLGSTVGTLAGYKDAAKEASDRGVQLHRERLWAELQPLRRSQETHLAVALADLAAEYVTAAARELESRITQEHESVGEALARLQVLRDSAEKTAEDRRAELAREADPLDHIEERIGHLAAEVATLDSAR